VNNYFDGIILYEIMRGEDESTGNLVGILLPMMRPDRDDGVEQWYACITPDRWWHRPPNTENIEYGFILSGDFERYCREIDIEDAKKLHPAFFSWLDSDASDGYGTKYHYISDPQIGYERTEERV